MAPHEKCALSAAEPISALPAPAPAPDAAPAWTPALSAAADVSAPVTGDAAPAASLRPPPRPGYQLPLLI